MNIRLTSSIAVSLLLARWRQTLVAAIGVTFSITMFIALLSFMNGLNQMLDGLVLNRTPHIRLYNEIKPNRNQPVNVSGVYAGYHNFIRSVKSAGGRQEIYNSGPILRTLARDRRVLGMTPRINSQAFFNDGVIDITGVINGIDITMENKLFHFREYIVAGDPDDVDKVPNSIILGKALAEKLLVSIGEMVQVTTPGGEPASLKVVGYFQSGLQEFDKAQAYASVKTVQNLLGRSADYITEIAIKMQDMRQSPATAKEYNALFNVDAEDIQTANAQFETGSFIRSLISYAVGITLLIVAGFGIYNILNMMIYEKMDTIAILKATGFSGGSIRSIFMLIAVSIGIFGSLLGLLLGFALSAIIDQVPFRTESLPTITTYPIDYNPVFYIIGILFSLVTTALAGWFPAQKASNIDPVIIIRGK
jgi:lipoprotein-releasing system permease protein